MIRYVAIAVALLAPAAAYAAEVADVLPSGAAASVGSVSYPGAMVLCAYILKNWKPPAINVRVAVDDQRVPPPPSRPPQ